MLGAGVVYRRLRLVGRRRDRPDDRLKRRQAGTEADTIHVDAGRDAARLAVIESASPSRSARDLARADARRGRRPGAGSRPPGRAPSRGRSPRRVGADHDRQVAAAQRDVAKPARAGSRWSCRRRPSRTARARRSARRTPRAADDPFDDRLAAVEPVVVDPPPPHDHHQPPARPSACARCAAPRPGWRRTSSRSARTPCRSGSSRSSPRRRRPRSATLLDARLRGLLRGGRR